MRDHRVFVGKLNPSELGFAERLMVKAVKAPYGDFRNWEDVRGWAREIAASLHSGSHTTFRYDRPEGFEKDCVEAQSGSHNEVGPQR